LLVIADKKFHPSICLFLLIYPIFRLLSTRPSLDHTVDSVDRACKLEYRLVTAWEYKSSTKKQVKSLLKEVDTLLEKADIHRIFKIKTPRLLPWAIPPLLLGIFFHVTLLSQIPQQALDHKTPVPEKEIAERQLHKKEIDVQKELTQMTDQIQDITTNLQEGALNEMAAINELDNIKERLQKNLDKEKGFLEFSVKSELMVKFFNKLAKLDTALAKIESKPLQDILKAISITIPIQVYNPNAPYDPHSARLTEGSSGGGPGGKGSSRGISQRKGLKVTQSTQTQNEIGELIDTQEKPETIPSTSKIAGRVSSTGAPVSFFSISHLPKSYQRLVQSYFGNP
jgi:hypothetical protein